MTWNLTPMDHLLNKIKGFKKIKTASMRDTAYQKRKFISKVTELTIMKDELTVAVLSKMFHRI